MQLQLFVCVVAVLGEQLTEAVVRDAVDTDKFNEMLNSYDSNQPPGAKTNVEVGLYVLDANLNTNADRINLDLYLRQKWSDQRLAQYFRLAGGDTMAADGEMVDSIWTPDIFLQPGKCSLKSDPFDQRFFRLKNKNGEASVWFVQSLEGTFTCPSLGSGTSMFADDTINCIVKLESFHYTGDSLSMSWLKEPVEFDKSIHIDQFELLGISLEDCGQNYTAGYFPCLSVRFSFRRGAWTSMIDGGVYATLFLLVLLSWIPLWYEAQRAQSMVVRLGIGIVILLIMGIFSLCLIMWNSYKGAYSEDYPRWLLGCWIFALLPLLEYCLVYLVIVIIPERLCAAKDGSSVKEPAEEGDAANEEPSGLVRVARIIDVAFAIVILPVLFLIFNIIFWSS